MGCCDTKASVCSFPWDSGVGTELMRMDSSFGCGSVVFSGSNLAFGDLKGEYDGNEKGMLRFLLPLQW